MTFDQHLVNQLQLVLTLQLHDFDVLLDSCFGNIYSKESIYITCSCS